MKRMFALKIDYFKPSGKWYAEADVLWPLDDCGSKEITEDGLTTLSPPCAYMPDADAKMRSLCATACQGSSLPGLGSSSWTGHILITCEDGYPILIPNLTRDEDKVPT
mgnify:CR=1 FL=1